MASFNPWPDRYWTVDEAAEQLGISVQYCRTLMSDLGLRRVESFGNRAFYALPDLKRLEDRYLTKRTGGPRPMFHYRYIGKLIGDKFQWSWQGRDEKIQARIKSLGIEPDGYRKSQVELKMLEAYTWPKVVQIAASYGVELEKPFDVAWQESRKEAQKGESDAR